VSGLDKSIANAWYEIEIEPSTQLPVRITMVVLTGTRGGTEAKKSRIVGGRHVAFHFTYTLSDFGKLKRPAIPPEAQRLLAKR